MGDINKKPHSSKVQIILLITISILGLFCYSAELLYFNFADGDLWYRLMEGASIWKNGSLIETDVFAFTPVLPKLIDHEWATGLIVFSLLKILGPYALSFYKILIASSVLVMTVLTARLSGTRWPSLFLLIIPCSICLLPAYMPVVRSHALTYLFFSIYLYCLEKMYKGNNWPSFLVIFIMVIWVNVHGGFIAGLGIIFIYILASAFFNRKRIKIFLLTFFGSILSTLINPYGFKLWEYLIPAVRLSREHHIGEWQAMTPFAFDIFLGFTILFAVTCFIFFIGIKKLFNKDNLAGILIVLLTCYLGFKHRRHAGFFAVAAGCFMGPYFQETVKKFLNFVPLKLRKINPLFFVLIIYFVFFIDVARFTLPVVSFDVVTTEKSYPVRAVDILSQANARGNIIIPLEYGGYVKWRLHPKVKISLDGGFEVIYPPSTINMNYDFFYKRGKKWDRIVKLYNVDYIIIRKEASLLNENDLIGLNYELVFDSGYSAFYAHKKIAGSLKQMEKNLTSRSFQPLDPDIPYKWL